MAKALFEKNAYALAGKAVSCGVIEGPIDGFVVAVLQEKGIDVSAHQAQVFDALDPANFGLIVSFSLEAEETKPANGLTKDVKPCSGMSFHQRQMSVHAMRC